MSYMQFYDDYRLLLQSGRMPIPYPYNIQYTNNAPNLNNEYNCWTNYYSSIPRNLYCLYGPDAQPDQLPCYDVTPFTDPSVSIGFQMIRLVSNIPEFAFNFDLNLLQPWGIIVINDKIWVTNVGTGLITCYNLRGEPLLPIINVFGPLGGISQTTGITYNYSPSSFLIFNGPLQSSSAIIVCTREGTINGYNSGINANVAQLLFNNTVNNAVYTGIVVVNTINDLIVREENYFKRSGGCSKNFMYVCDFFNKRIDVFNEKMNPIAGRGFNFVDENTDIPIPNDYSPYNIVNIGDYLYVAYARQRPDDNQYELFGSGFGFISIFTLDGNFVRRFASNKSLNAPWGIMEAPSAFGYPAGSIMISNYGDGVINIFDSNGSCIGPLRDSSYNTIYFGSLRGITFNPIYTKQIYWVSSENMLKQAYVGTVSCRN